MMEIIKDIQDRIEKLEQLAGFDYCSCCKVLDRRATEKDWINAWNRDSAVIKSMINDMELYCDSVVNEH